MNNDNDFNLHNMNILKYIRYIFIPFLSKLKKSFVLALLDVIFVVLDRLSKL